MAEYDRMSEWDLDRDLPRRRPVMEEQRNRGNRDNTRGYGDPRNARMSEVRRRRKRRQRIRRMILVIILAVILMGALGFGIYYLIKNVSFNKPAFSKSESNVYKREIDITDAVAGDIAVWLSSVEGEEINTQWVKDRCGDITVSATLTLGKDEEGNKTFSEGIDESSYNAMSINVDGILNSLLSEIIANELIKSGYADSVSPEEAANISVQILGMNMSDYIKENGVNIVPSINEINGLYTLGSGTYSMSRGEVTLNLASGEAITETVISKKESLVFVNSGKVYTKEGNENE